jgi:hypothetical protein
VLRFVYFAGLLIVLGMVAGCGSSSPTIVNTQVAPLETTAATAVAGSVATPSTSPFATFPATGGSPIATGVLTTTVTAIAGTPTIAASPTITETATLSPTPGPPTATFTPAPSQQTYLAAQNLDQALVTFAEARASGNAQAALQAQRKLLDAANAAAVVAATDQSSYGQQLRSAIDAVNSGAAGNSDAIDQAHKALTQIAVGTGTPVVTLPRPAAQSQQSLTDVSRNLRQAVESYQQALNTGNGDDLLRAQRDLLTAVTAADAATKDNRSPDAQPIQQALSSIHDALGGDTGKLAAADAALGGTGGAALASPSPSPEPSPSPSPEPSPSPSPEPSPSPSLTPSPSPQLSPSTTPSPQPVDLQPIEGDVDNKLQALQSAAADPNKGNLSQAQADLQSAIQRASGAVANDQSPQANQFRNALATAQQAAAGDQTKIQEARDALRAAVSH